MRAPKLVERMKQNADRMSEAVIDKIKSSPRCKEMLAKISAPEQKCYALNVYSDLISWLASETDSTIEERYMALGSRRAEQGVPFSELFWAVCIASEYLWEYMQQECLLEEPVEFWGGIQLLRSLNQFFDRVVYFALIGYQKAGNRELAYSA